MACTDTKGSTPMVSGKGQAGLAPNNGRWVLAATILASSMAFIDSSALNVALPALQADLHATGEQLLWVINGYMLMLAALILTGGSLGDILGRKKVFMAGIVLFLLGSLACGLAPSVELLIAARVVQGIGGALMIPGSLAIITVSFGDQRGQAIGTWSATTTMVTIAGPILGGFLADAGLWRAVFLINIPLGLAALVVLWSKVAESRDDSARTSIDYVGAALTVLGLAGLTYGLLAAPARGLLSPMVLASLVIGVAALVSFVVVEARSHNPMLPLNLFNSRTFSGTNLLTLFLYGALTASSFFLSLNLVQVQGYRPAIAGFAFLPFALLLTLLSRRAGAWADKHGARRTLIAGPALVGVGFLLLAFVGLTAGPAAYWTTFLPGIIVFGLGMAITVAPLTSTVMGAVTAQYAGTASGVNNAVSRTAGVLATAILGALALVLFGAALQNRTLPLGLTPAAQQALATQAGQLGAAKVPPEVPEGAASAVQLAIRLAFVAMFRGIMLICAGLAFLSAAIAWLLVERDTPSTTAAKSTASSHTSHSTTD